jgi:hypothetical protein
VFAVAKRGDGAKAIIDRASVSVVALFILDARPILLTTPDERHGAQRQHKQRKAN